MEKLNSRQVSLTPRDVVLLKGLYDQTVLSFSQIRQRYFAPVSNPTISNRLSRLRKGGLIYRMRVPRLMEDGARSQIETVFQITKPGIRELQKRDFENVLREEPIKLNAYSVDHDVLLNDVMQALAKRFCGSKVIHGRHWDENQNATGVNPDAILLGPDGKLRWAVELELTLKSESRYREIVLKYRMANHFHKVIYVTSHPAVREKISKVLGSTPMFVGGKPVTGKFFFTEVHALVGDPKNAAITNGSDFLKQGALDE